MSTIAVIPLLVMMTLFPNNIGSKDIDMNNPNNCLFEENYPFCQDESVLNGYWWDKLGSWEWVPVYPSIRSWFLPAFVSEPKLMRGSVSYYAAGVMEATAEVRNLSLEGFRDGISLMSPADIGQTVWLYTQDYGWYGPLLVADCAKHGDIYPLVVLHNEIAELGAKSAEELGLVSSTGDVIKYKLKDVLISRIDPSLLDLNNVSIVDFRTWWLDNLSAGTYRDLYKVANIPPCTWRLNMNGSWITTCNISFQDADLDK